MALRTRPRTRSAGLLLALCLAIGLLGRSAAQGEGGGADAASETPVAWVRVAHFSPNAPALEVTLLPDAEPQEPLRPDALQDLAYRSASDFLEVPAGGHLLRVSAAGETLLEQHLELAADRHHTAALIGLQLSAAEQPRTDDGNGFLAFVRELFGGDDAAPDRLALQLLLVEDPLDRDFAEGETLVRLLHASPGTAEVDLAIVGEQGVLTRDAEFGGVSTYRAVAGDPATLEVRVAGSRVGALPLADAGIEPNTIATVAVIGTSLERAPLEVVVLSAAPQRAEGGDGQGR